LRAGTFRLALTWLQEVRGQQSADPAVTESNGPAPPPYPAEKVRGGEIILRTPRRAIFAGVLAGAVVPGLLLAFAR